MVKPTVAVIFGSRSAEHDVSIITAIASIIKPLELSKKYHVVPVYIAKDGRWFMGAKLRDIKLYSSGKIDKYMRKNKPVAVQFDGGLTLLRPGLTGEKVKVDVVFPATHGTYGEDGSLMGVLRMANVPFVGCDMEASAIAMDKLATHSVCAAAGIPSHHFAGVAANQFSNDQASVLKQLKALRFPLFVKPVHLGSSIAISKVTNQEELANALEVVFHYDDHAIVEEAVPNLVEVTVPIMGNDVLTVANTEEPVQGDAFFDFETKYMQGGKKGAGKGGKQGAQGYSHMPARLPEALQQECLDVAQAAYRAVGCEGTARVDLLVDSQAKKVYLNEINPLPGDLYAHNWNKAGVSNIQLVTRLIELAEERHQQQQKLTTTFSTNYLKQF